VAKDSVDENVIWVTEVWDSVASHDASLSLPSVKNAMPRAKALISAFDKMAVTTPVGESGSQSADLWKSECSETGSDLARTYFREHLASDG
jgi:hypothetical protein